MRNGRRVRVKSKVSLSQGRGEEGEGGEGRGGEEGSGGGDGGSEDAADSRTSDQPSGNGRIRARLDGPRARPRAAQHSVAAATLAEGSGGSRRARTPWLWDRPANAKLAAASASLVVDSFSFMGMCICVSFYLAAAAVFGGRERPRTTACRLLTID